MSLYTLLDKIRARVAFMSRNFKFLFLLSLLPYFFYPFLLPSFLPSYFLPTHLHHSYTHSFIHSHSLIPSTLRYSVHSSIHPPTFQQNAFILRTAQFNCITHLCYQIVLHRQFCFNFPQNSFIFLNLKIVVTIGSNNLPRILNNALFTGSL